MGRKRDWGVFLRKLKIKTLLSQAEIAEKVGVSQQTVSSWSLGIRTPGYKHRRILITMMDSQEFTGEKTTTLEISDEPVDALKSLADTLRTEDVRSLVTFGKMFHTTRSLQEQMEKCKQRNEILENILNEGPVVHWSAIFHKHSTTLNYVSDNFSRITGFDDFEPDKWAKTAVIAEDRDGYNGFHRGSIRNVLENAVFEYRIESPSGKSMKIRERRRSVKKGTTISIFGTFEAVF